MRPRYNIAPAQTVPVICRWRGQIEFMRWGLIPVWQKSEGGKIPTGYRNARIESVAEKPAFKRAFASQRCLIPASGFYEWRLTAGRKQPYWVTRRDSALLGLAGIASTWRAENGVIYSTCAILTQPAEGALQTLHERSPVVVAPEYYAEWLASKVFAAEAMKTFFLPWNDQNVMMYAVTLRMSRAEIDGPECILPLGGLLTQAPEA